MQTTSIITKSWASVATGPITVQNSQVFPANPIRPFKDLTISPKNLTKKDFRPITISKKVISQLGIPYIHTEGSDTIYQVSWDKLPISSSFPIKSIRNNYDLIEPLFSGLSGYVVLPAYFDDDKIEDFQLCISGSPWDNGETFYNASVRETAEETGLKILPKDFFKSCIHDTKYKGFYLSVNVPSNVSSAVNVTYNKPLGVEDDKSNKVMTWTVVKEPEEIISRSRVSSDDIAGQNVIIMSVYDMLTLCQTYFNKYQ
jgi:hypothetical protein